MRWLLHAAARLRLAYIRCYYGRSPRWRPLPEDRGVAGYLLALMVLVLGAYATWGLWIALAVAAVVPVPLALVAVGLARVDQWLYETMFADGAYERRREEAFERERERAGS